MADFVMPSLGADMEFGTILEWLVEPGDVITRGQIVAVIDTEKATFEMECFQPGVVEELVAPVGAEVPVAGLLARIRAEEAGAATPPTDAVAPPAPVLKPEGGVAAVPALPTEPAGATPSVPTPSPPKAVSTPAAPSSGIPRRRVSPLARRAAQRLGVDLVAVRGTGTGGAVTKADVEGAAASRAGEPAVVAEKAPSDRAAAMRAAIAKAMSRSKREIPHYYLHHRVDMSTAMLWLERANRERPVRERLLAAALLIRAVALAVGAAPELNGWWRDDAFEPADAVHVGFAIALPHGGGLIAPAIHDVDRKPVDAIMRDLRDLVERARAGRLRTSEITDVTITITSLGDRGVEAVYGVVYPPQVALVGFGAISEEPWAVNGMVGARPVVHATLAADHRASDGNRGALFLHRIGQLLQRPEEL